VHPSRFHRKPDVTPPQISPHLRSHPTPDFTPPQICCRFQPTPVSMVMRVPGFHTLPDWGFFQLDLQCRLSVSPESGEMLWTRAPRSLPSTANKSQQKTPPRRKFLCRKYEPKIFCRGGESGRRVSLVCRGRLIPSFISWREDQSGGTG